MKARRVVISFEVETDASAKSIRNQAFVSWFDQDTHPVTWNVQEKPKVTVIQSKPKKAAKAAPFAAANKARRSRHKTSPS